NDSGALRLAFGGLRDLIIGITVVLADGTIASSGGKVVKNVAGYDLPKLMTGAMGTLGVITSATFRLHPLPKQASTLTLDSGDLQRQLLAILHAPLAISAMQVRNREIDVLLEGTDAGISAQKASITELAPSLREGSAAVWNARQQLWPPAKGEAIAKFS